MGVRRCRRNWKRESEKKKKRNGTEGETWTRKEIGRYTRIHTSSLCSRLSDPLKKESRVGGRTPEVPFSRHTRINDDARNIHPWPFWSLPDTCVLDLFLHYTSVRVCLFIPGGKSDLRYKMYECPRHGVGRGRQANGRNTVGVKRLSIVEIVKLENLSSPASIRLSIVDFAHRFHFSLNNIATVS